MDPFFHHQGGRQGERGSGCRWLYGFAKQSGRAAADHRFQRGGRHDGPTSTFPAVDEDVATMHRANQHGAPWIDPAPKPSSWSRNRADVAEIARLILCSMYGYTVILSAANGREALVDPRRR